MNERIRNLREHLGLNQHQFSIQTKISRSMIAMFETGDREMKDIHISQICHAFNVNEEWLRTGNGEMFNQRKSTLVSQLAHEYNLDSLDQAIIETYIELPSEYRKGLKAFLSSVTQKLQAASEDHSKQDDVVDNSELFEQARQMMARVEETRVQPPYDNSTKKNA